MVMGERIARPGSFSHYHGPRAGYYTGFIVEKPASGSRFLPVDRWKWKRGEKIDSECPTIPRRTGGVRSLLTGGGGFAARAIGPALVAAGHDLAICLRPGRAAPEWTSGLAGRVTVHWVDLAGEEGLEAVFADRDIIIHAAGSLEDPGAPADVFDRNNTRVTKALISGALATGCPRFINFSSVSIHGSIDVDLVDAGTPSSAPSFYGASKIACENALHDVAARLASISLRPPGIVGPNAHGNWLSRCRTALRADAPVSIANPDFQFNNVVHADDLAAFIIDLCRQNWVGARAIPIGAGAPMSIRSMISMMKERIGSSSRIDVMTNGQRPFAISSDAAVRDFGYRPAPVATIINRFAGEP
jgi:nucleoside-diphosphate-sugar epimerase